jgi:hypothetical protein
LLRLLPLTPQQQQLVPLLAALLPDPRCRTWVGSWPESRPSPPHALLLPG